MKTELRNRRPRKRHKRALCKQEKKNHCNTHYFYKKALLSARTLSKNPIQRNIPYLSPEKPVCRLRSNSYNWTWSNGLVPNWERSTVSKLGKVSSLYIDTLIIYLICRVCHEKMLGWMKHKLESRLLREVSITSDVQITPPL